MKYFFSRGTWLVYAEFVYALINAGKFVSGWMTRLGWLTLISDSVCVKKIWSTTPLRFISFYPEHVAFSRNFSVPTPIFFLYAYSFLLNLCLWETCRGKGIDSIHVYFFSEIIILKISETRSKVTAYSDTMEANWFWI